MPIELRLIISIPYKKEIILDCLGGSKAMIGSFDVEEVGPSVTVKVRERLEDARMLALKMREVARSQGMQLLSKL